MFRRNQMDRKPNRRTLVKTSGILAGIAVLGGAAPTLAQDATPDDAMGGTPMTEESSDMGGGMLGGSAQTETLAEVQVEELPDKPLAWVAYAAAPEASLTHEHSLGFIYAEDEAHTVTIDGQETMLQPGEAVFVAQDVEHTRRRQLLGYPADGPGCGPALRPCGC
jgi:hypothetical protein